MINTFTQDRVVAVPYGSSTLDLQLARTTTHLQPQDPEITITTASFRQKLEHALESNPLDLSNPVLVVADKTRRCEYPVYLPVLVDGITKRRGRSGPLQIIIAYGTHPFQTEQECLDCYGPLYKEYNFTHHDCHDTSLFEEVGVTPAGTPVRLRKDLLEASAVITMGPMCHHYFAGYGGGRKLIFPGCGEKEAIYQNHGLFLDRQNRCLAKSCQPGVFEDNPVATDLFDIESHLMADLAIHGIQDSHGNICDFLIGRGRQTYLDGCATHGAHFEVQIPRVDTVVASCGGYPKDINFIQAHKSIHNCAGFVKDGGRLIVFAECCDGVGSKTFLPWFSEGGYDNAFTKLSASYEGNGGTALALMAKTRRIEIALVTELEDSTCRLLGLDRWELAEVERYLQTDCGQVAWIDNGSLLVNTAGWKKEP